MPHHHDRRTDPAGPAIHVLDNPEVARWAATEDERGDVRDGDVLLMPTFGVAAVKIEGKTHAITEVPASMSDAFPPLSNQHLRRCLHDYRPTFEAVSRELGTRPEFNRPAALLQATGWERTAVVFTTVEVGDYLLTHGSWNRVIAHRTTPYPVETNHTRVETVVRTATGHQRRLVSWIEWEDGEEAETRVPVWRQLPPTAIRID